MRSLVLALLALGCGPIRNEVRVPNPAKTTSSIEARQVYEIGPFKEDHRYEVTLARWKPSALDFAVHLRNVGDCGRPQSYTFTLVDDRGGEHPLRPLAPPAEIQTNGRAGGKIAETSFTGEADATVGPSTQFVVLRIRPVQNRTCSELDFTWRFE